jgi:thiamine-monophosphate kinase
MEPASPTLGQLGERRIVEELIRPRFAGSRDLVVGIGDDCAVLSPPPPGEVIVFTTDPCPTPVIVLLGDTDFYHYGRMTVLINVSDLAAMGAIPVGLLTSTVMPEEMKVSEYERFLDGLVDASLEWSCPIVGGNIKDGPTFTATGTALGRVERDFMMLRTGAMPRDRVLVVGEMGLFWAAVLQRMNPLATIGSEHTDLLWQVLSRPVARLREGRILGASGLVTACMDSSDGVIGCLQELALKNLADVVVEAPLLAPHPVVEQVAQRAAIDPRKLMLSWGDWQLVCTVRPQDANTVIASLQSTGTVCHDIGRIAEGSGRVVLEEDGKQRLITNFASERFSPTSFFSHGLEAYIAFLKQQPLTT